MSGAPRVSVIIPCYNHGRYLDEAILSVQRQRHRPLEIIVVDDGSKDDTRARATAHPDVRYVYKDNAGLAAARNTGLSICSSDYVVFLDADDRLLPHCVRSNLKLLVADPSLAFAAGNFRWISGDGSALKACGYHGVKGDYYRRFLERNFIGMHAAVMYRRDMLREIGGFDPRFRACEDYDVYLRLTQRHPIICHDTVLAEYRRHGSGLSNNAPLMLASAFAALHAQLPFIESSGDPRMLEAYHSGLKKWRNLYGRELLTSIVQAFKSRDWSKAARLTRVLIPLVPKAMFEQLLRKLGNVQPGLSAAGDKGQNP